MTFPFGTLFVNTLGSFLIALIMGFLLTMAKANNLLSEPLRLLLTVGFLGGFTTFSSFSMETLTLLRSGSVIVAIANIAANVILGLIAAILGLCLTSIFQGARPWQLP
jgi:CrcB protein